MSNVHEPGKPWYQRIKWELARNSEFNHEYIKNAFAQIALHDKTPFYVSNWYASACEDVHGLMTHLDSLPGVFRLTEYVMNQSDSYYSNIGWLTDDVHFA